MSNEIYQVFNLDIKRLESLGPEKSKRVFPRGQELLEKLAQMGYKVLTNMSQVGTIPTSIILGGEALRRHKEDFYTLANQLELPFSSGEAYTHFVKQ